MMSEWFVLVARGAVFAIEFIGISIIACFALEGLISAVRDLFARKEKKLIFRFLRYRLGGGILLGLEFLIAADIIRTVTVDLTFKSVGILAMVVLIRTFLSFALEVELTGRWPWQKRAVDSSANNL